MKKINKYITVLIMAVTFLTACELDDDAPNGELYGVFTTSSDKVLFGDNKRDLTTVSVKLEDDETPIKIRVKPDGTYARSILIGGIYNVSFDGPFFPIEDQTIEVNGREQLNVNVIPYMEYELKTNEVSSTSATMNYKVKANNGAIPTRRTIVWSELPYPTVQDYAYTGYDGGRLIDSGETVMVNDQGEQAGSYVISELKPNTTYYIRIGGRTDDTPVTPNPSSFYNYSNEIMIKTTN
jgi:hypothetical protein